MVHDTPKRRTPWNTLSARVLSVVSRKGGVGKTTSVVNLGAAFALSGHSVLVVGVDPQCGASRSLGYGPDDLDGGLLDVFQRQQPLTHLAHPTALKNLFVVSSRVTSLEEEEQYLAAMRDQVDLFVREVDRARNLYDTILLDCPPALSPATRAALQASDSYLVPVQAEELCRDSLGPLIATVDTFRDRVFGRGAGDAEGLDRPLEIEGIFLTMMSERTRMSRHVAARVAEEFGPILLDAAVPRNARLAEMALRGKPAVIYDRRCQGSRAYFDLADELVARFREREGLPTAVEIPEDPQAEDDVESPDARRALAAVGGGLDRLLYQLQAAGTVSRPLAPAADELAEPDLVSLEELLAEEEKDDGRPWDDA